MKVLYFYSRNFLILITCNLCDVINIFHGILILWCCGICRSMSLTPLQGAKRSLKSMTSRNCKSSKLLVFMVIDSIFFRSNFFRFRSVFLGIWALKRLILIYILKFLIACVMLQNSVFLCFFYCINCFVYLSWVIMKFYFENPFVCANYLICNLRFYNLNEEFCCI